MVTLNDPITSQNIVDRFEELVTDIADTQIVWGTDNLPGHSAFTSADFGGVVDGMELVLTNATGTFTANETVTWSINGGNDPTFFSINSTTGLLTFNNASARNWISFALAFKTYKPNL